MGKGKLAKFAELKTFSNVFEYPYRALGDAPFPMRGRWREDCFGNNNDIVLELGCGRGEYTVGLARKFPDTNFIGVDIKGARMYTGAKQALTEGLTNAAFLRTNIELIDRFFAPDEVQELWITFPDPQMKNPRKRLTSTFFLDRYRHFLMDGGAINLKTDSNFLYTYTLAMAEASHLPIEVATENLYEQGEGDDAATSIKTYYEGMWTERGISIRFLRFCLLHSATLVEPDVEIPHDTYRSYHRGTAPGE